MYTKTSQKWYMIQGTHIYIYITLALLFMFLFTLLSFFWAGWLSSIPFVCYRTSIDNSTVDPWNITLEKTIP
jgi:hypothetical protein